jgi:putative membrane protein
VPDLVGLAAPHGGPMALSQVLRSWSFDPPIVAGVLTVQVLYFVAARRVTGALGAAAFLRRRVVFFMSGLVVLYLALQSPLDTYSELLFSVHMVQHILLTMIAAPLIILGTPIWLALRASSPSTRRRVLLPVLHSRVVKVLASPVVGWALFATVMWGSHYPSVYQAALQDSRVHALEHLAYLASALLFWWPVIGLDPSPTRISHPARILYLFLAMPVTSLLGLAISSTNRIL